jgi:putative addiction module component (TIGR02574 family)
MRDTVLTACENRLQPAQIQAISEGDSATGGDMDIPGHKIDIATLSPIQKMELADLLYDTARQELEASSAPLTDEQKREVVRRVAAADRGELTAEPWDTVHNRLQRSS